MGFASPNPDWKTGVNPVSNPFYQIAALASNDAFAIFFDRRIAMLLEENSMIPDFKGHHFVEDWKPNAPPSRHHCEQCGMEAMLRPDGSTLFAVGRRGVFLKASDRIPLNALPVPSCTVGRPRPA